jgi:NitT/TauT family transport system ATP-binding protein
MASLLEVDDVSLHYKTAQSVVVATNKVSFRVAQSDRYILLGPSGCGKSTLLKAVGGFHFPVEGEIRLKGEAVVGPGLNRVMVFQEFDQLFPWKTVLENVKFPLTRAKGLEANEADEIARTYIEKVGLTKFSDSYPHALSGGMKQRAAIARGMAVEPDILLMDEPFAALDALTRRRMQDELLRLWEDTRVTILFVTHSIAEAIRIGTKILVLSPHPGTVRAEVENVEATRTLGSSAEKLEKEIHDLLFAEETTPARAT